ncbi:OmpA family protein [Marilutibacter alkalisoli]|uniref:OmpA family protein n=1 Tax=Marilutibacter alkalisoli TaxID=2591633 RepID=A0A514BVY7_9GAMM|nr:OmpA family protein [Lysobacter alkalisoli]QDH71583.1 OmpA family protein [Lysobacter alkalisoli]
MIHRPFSFLGLTACLALAACGGDAPPPADEPETDATAEASTEPESDEPKAFDITTIPVSDAPLGEFPYFQLPEGYHTTEKLSSTIEVGQFPFWVGEFFIGVEGRIHQANIRGNEGKAFSALEVEQAIRNAITSAGGVEIANMVIPRSRTQDVLTRSFTQEFSNGLCWPKEPVRTYVVHRTDKDIWVHACTYGGIGAAWVIAETATAEPEFEVVSSDTLRERLRTEGRVAIPVGFASASAELLPGAAAQIREIVTLLEQEAEWLLDINVHVDDSGSAQHSMALSEARARAVAEAMAAAGAGTGRLKARGLGRSEPIADNGTPEGRAKNRRVELVLQGQESEPAAEG